MGQGLFVSDGSLIIDLLWKYNFYATYARFFKELYLLEDAKEIINSFPFVFDDIEKKTVELISDEFKIENKSLIPDILLFLKVFKANYKNALNRKLQEHGIEELNFMKELKTLDKLLNYKLDENYSQLKHIQLKFRRGSKIPAINIEDRTIIKHIIDRLKDFLSNKDQQFYLKSLEHPGGKAFLEKLCLNYGKPSDKKDTLKSTIRDKACYLLKEYFYWKVLSGFNDEVHITNKNAELIGKLLSLANLIISEDEFNNNSYLVYCYSIYENYLTQMVKSYLSTGRKSL